MSRIHAMKGFCLLLCGLLTMSACSDADSRDETLAVYGATVFTVLPTFSVVTDEVSVQADTYRRVFHSEVSYGQPLVALRFSDGGQVYKCSIEDQDRARLERLEPDYRDYGFLERLK